MAEMIDVSVPVSPSTVSWENESAPVIERVSSIEAGDGYNLSRLAFSVHTGTHVDAPSHFIESGGAVETLALDALIGPALVVDARDAENEIDAERVAHELPTGCQRVLFSTRNSGLWEEPGFCSDSVGISPRAASLLVERGIRLVGIDYLSVGPPETHRELLSHNVVLLEGLDLRGVAAGRYRLLCLPLRIVGSDGAPARAVLTTL
ncbi:MAG TPA: cyclase family protein [Gaiellaceae bacterium]